MPRARCSTRSRKNIPWLLGGSADLARRPRRTLNVRGRRRLPGRHARRPQPPLRHPRARDGRDRSTAWRSPSCAPFGATFLIFSDYARPAIRLSALMELPAIYVFTHDSIGVGEDGPTHQPIEHLASLRAIPGLVDAAARRRQRGRRGAAAYVMQLRHEPAVLVLTRQALPTLDRTKYAPAAGCREGRLRAGRRRRRQARGDPDRHRQRGVALPSTRTRSSPPRASARASCRMPSWELFEHQTAGVPRQRAAAGGHRARRRRAGLDLRLGALRRRRRAASSACRPSAPRRR